MKYVAILLLGLSSSIFAEELTFGFHLGSQHTPDHGGRANNLNPGAYLVLPNGITAGFYKNSLHKDTFYAGYTTAEWMRLRLTVGAASGYQKDGLIPIIVPTVRLFTAYDWNLKLAYIPKIDSKSSEIWHLMIDKSFE